MNIRLSPIDATQHETMEAQALLREAVKHALLADRLLNRANQLTQTR